MQTITGGVMVQNDWLERAVSSEERLQQIETENAELRRIIRDLQQRLNDLNQDAGVVSEVPS